MPTRGVWIMGAALAVTALLGAWLPSDGAGRRTGRAPSQAEEPVPAFHPQPPAGALPQTMDPGQFENPVVKNSYAVAAKIKKVLYQQPCYCHCDRGHGHGSLLDCFTSTHGSVCNICMGEALYSYEQTRKGQTPAQIRARIQKGEWQQIDATKYQTYPARP
jgi:hypothetical protein